MNWLTFIAEVIKAIAWPSAVVGVALVFRHEFRRLLSSMSVFRYKDFELEFGRKMEVLKAEAEQANLPPLEERIETHVAKGLSGRPPQFDYLSELVDVAPKAAVMEAWREVEGAIRDAAHRLGLPPARADRDIVHQLRASGHIDSGLTQIIDSLRQLRNSIAHVGDIELSVARAQEYVTLALRFIEAMREMG